MRLRPTAVDVEVLPEHKLRITFDNDEIRIFDVTPYIKGDWFGELRDDSVFNTVRPNGMTIEWSGGQDICPDCLYNDSEPETLITKRMCEEKMIEDDPISVQ